MSAVKKLDARRIYKKFMAGNSMFHIAVLYERPIQDIETCLRNYMLRRKPSSPQGETLR